MKNIRLVLTILFLGFSAVSLTTCGGGGDTSSSAPLASISLSPVTPVGATQQFAALGTFSDGTIHDVSPQVTWTSSNTLVATVTNSGQATSFVAGTAPIVATTQTNYFSYQVGNISGVTTLLVLP